MENSGNNGNTSQISQICNLDSKVIGELGKGYVKNGAVIINLENNEELQIIGLVDIQDRNTVPRLIDAASASVIQNSGIQVECTGAGKGNEKKSSKMTPDAKFKGPLGPHSMFEVLEDHAKIYAGKQSITVSCLGDNNNTETSVSFFDYCGKPIVNETKQTDVLKAAEGAKDTGVKHKGEDDDDDDIQIVAIYEDEDENSSSSVEVVYETKTTRATEPKQRAPPAPKKNRENKSSKTEKVLGLSLAKIINITPSEEYFSELSSTTACPSCSRQISRGQSIDSHILTHIGQPGHEKVIRDENKWEQIHRKKLLTHCEKVDASCQPSDYLYYLRYFCPMEICRSKRRKHFEKLKYLKQHYLKMHAVRSLPCGKCSEQFPTLTLKEAHEKICGITFRCGDCMAQYKDFNTLQTHSRRTGHTFDRDGYMKLIAKTSVSAGTSADSAKSTSDQPFFENHSKWSKDEIYTNGENPDQFESAVHGENVDIAGYIQVYELLPANTRILWAQEPDLVPEENSTKMSSFRRSRLQSDVKPALVPILPKPPAVDSAIPTLPKPLTIDSEVQTDHIALKPLCPSSALKRRHSAATQTFSKVSVDTQTPYKRRRRSAKKSTVAETQTMKLSDIGVSVQVVLDHEGSANAIIEESLVPEVSKNSKSLNASRPPVLKLEMVTSPGENETCSAGSGIDVITLCDVEDQEAQNLYRSPEELNAAVNKVFRGYETGPSLPLVPSEGIIFNDMSTSPMHFPEEFNLFPELLGVETQTELDVGDTQLASTVVNNETQTLTPSSSQVQDYPTFDDLILNDSYFGFGADESAWEICDEGTQTLNDL